MFPSDTPTDPGYAGVSGENSEQVLPVPPPVTPAVADSDAAPSELTGPDAQTGLEESPGSEPAEPMAVEPEAETPVVQPMDLEPVAEERLETVAVVDEAPVIEPVDEPVDQVAADEEFLSAVAEEFDAIEAALVRLDDGSFDNCQVCGGRIGQDRLMADPLLSRCPAHT